MLKNTNGTPYQSAGSLQQFDPENQDFNLFNLWDQEVIQIGGSPIFYYEMFLQRSTIDKIYFEDRGKLFSDQPIQLWALYEPIPSQNAMSVFGMHSPDEMVFELNYRAVLQAIGHPPKIGSRIFTPHLREDWVIIQRNVGEFKMWGRMRLQLLCARFQESVTTGEGKVTQKKPDFTIR